MMNEHETISKAKKVDTWISAILLGDTRELIARIDERTTLMQIDLRDIKPKVDDMFPKVDILWKDRVAPARSPRTLNARGEAILGKSGIKEIIDANKAGLYKLVQAKNVMNEYDMENAVLEVVKKLPMYYPDTLEDLKQGAFSVGASVDEVLLVGGIYLRDLIFSDGDLKQ